MPFLLIQFNQSSSLGTFSFVTPEDWRNVRTPDQFCLTYIFIGLSVETAHMIGRIIVRNKYFNTKLSSHCSRRDNPRTKLSIPEQNPTPEQFWGWDFNPRMFWCSGVYSTPLIACGLMDEYNLLLQIVRLYNLELLARTITKPYNLELPSPCKAPEVNKL